MTDGKVTNINVGHNQNTSHFSRTYTKLSILLWPLSTLDYH